MRHGRFEYLAAKIANAEFSESPFKHIWINDFFTDEDFREIIQAEENALKEAKDDSDLFDRLFDAGYKIIEFPGCITSKKDYLKWRSGHSKGNHHSACEGFGITLRLTSPRSQIFSELKNFLEGSYFNRVMADKFGIELDDCKIDGGIQKYLDGYEISPHPDIRRKALTFMVNINPHSDCEQAQHHTHYMTLTPERKYVETFWEGNPHVNRCWVPWNWCKTESLQTRNNSIVIFAPSNDTLHAVKAKYDHLKGQRTQLYGNLWYREAQKLQSVQWEDLDFTAHQNSAGNSASPLRMLASKLVPKQVKSALRNFNKSDTADVGSRNL